jgi:hypothetical protein
MVNDVRRLGVVVLAAGLLASCTTDALNRDVHDSFLTSEDLVTMTDRMARSIVSDLQVQQVIATKPMVIVMKPIRNETNEIILPAEKELYVHRVRVLLSSKPELRDKFVFVLNREDYEKLQAEEGISPAELGTPEARVQPEYALAGTFYADTNVSSKMRTDTYLCTFRLTKLQGEGTGVELWADSYETKKLNKKAFLD